MSNWRKKTSLAMPLSFTFNLQTNALVREKSENQVIRKVIKKMGDTVWSGKLFFLTLIDEYFKVNFMFANAINTLYLCYKYKSQ
jgi:hypothetical protein